MKRTPTLSITRRQKRERQNLLTQDRVTRFAVALPHLRSQVDHDLRRRRLMQDHIAASIIRRFDEELSRAVSAARARTYDNSIVSIPLTQHVDMRSTYVDFNVRGTNGLRHERDVMHFSDEAAIVRGLSSNYVNAYVKQSMGEEFGASDFQTWAGTVSAVTALLSATGELPSTRVDLTGDVHDASSLKLSHVDPRVLTVTSHPEVIESVRALPCRARKHFAVDEQRTLALLHAVTSQMIGVRAQDSARHL